MLNQRGSFLQNIPPVTRNLIGLNLVIWLFMFIAPASIGDKLVSWCGLHYIGAPDFNVAQIFTYMFMHDTGSFAHIVFNMFTLFMFGRIIESAVGSQRFLIYYITCGIGAALVQEFIWFLSLDSIIGSLYGIPASMVDEARASGLLSQYGRALNMLVTVGASGAIYGVLLAFGMLFPNLPIMLLFFPVPIKAKWMVIGFGVVELLIGMSGRNDGVAHFAHLGGMLFGILIILWWRKKGYVHGPYY